jgi:hypothetical protein
VAGKPVETRTEASFTGRWRIVEMEQWTKEYLDEEGPAHITFAEGGLGQLHFLLINAEVDWSYDAEIDRVDFTFMGSDEMMDDVSGRGWAKIAGRGKQMVGEIAIHLGDESGFKARKSR